jgi:hypothetical protein
MNNPIDYWSENELENFYSVYKFNNETAGVITTYWNNGTSLDKDTIKRIGRCISEDAYSWGFSSLLLLTFWCFTIAVASASISLPTDVYWNSSYDHHHQFHSIYIDVLYLAEELKSIFGLNLKDKMRSPRAFGKEVEHQKQGFVW